MCMGGSAPDYEGAAREEGKTSLANTNLQTWANRPNINTPLGSMNWTPTSAIDPATGQNVTKWGMNVSLSPDLQAALNTQNRLKAGQSELAGNLMGQVNQNFSQPLDFGGLGPMPNAEGARSEAIGAAYNQMASRLDPMWANKESAFRTMALNEGGDPRNDAYRTGYADLMRGRNDAYQSALNNAIVTGGNQASQYFDMGLRGRQQGISEMLTQRAQPFNEMQALLGGAQVAQPNFPGFSQAGRAETPNLLAAAQAQGQYSLAQQQQFADMIGGGMNLAGNAFMFG